MDCFGPSYDCSVCGETLNANETHGCPGCQEVFCKECREQHCCEGLQEYEC